MRQRLKIKVTFLFFALLALVQGYSQNQPSSIQSNYSGILSIPSQPANIADNRYKIDINLVTINWSAYNNYIALKGHSFPWYAQNSPWSNFTSEQTGDSAAFWQNPNFQDEFLFERVDDQDKSVHNYNEIMGPSILYTIDEKNAFSFTWRGRSLLNIDGIGPELAKVIYRDRQVPDLWGALLSNPKVGIASMNWVEYGLGYGRVVYDDHKHFMKVGVNLKLAQGMNAVYMQFEDFDYRIDNGDSISIPRKRVNYGRSNRYDPSNPSEHFSYNFDSKISPAFDIGFIYEYRPNREKFKYDMDGEYDQWMNDKNKYKWKVGISITDIGRLKFDKSPTSNDFFIDTSNRDVSSLSIKEWDDFERQVVGQYDVASGDERTFTMSLPTALSLQIDYNVWQNFYVNFTPYWAIYDKASPTKVHNITSYSLTPRFESQWFDLMIPFSYNNYGNTAIGLSARVGPLTIGTTDFTPYVAAGNIFGVDGYFSLKIPIFRKGKPSDRDEDQVSDKKDNCPEIAGLMQFQGCPDIDNDGIPDVYDDCPADSGIAEFRGCPDRDGDDIIDRYDECPDIPGILAFQGCPDSDGDSIIDPRDSCPTLAGIIFYHGCPDTDGDSIIDPDDLCPEHPGPIENGGCPDTDKDGIFDYLDECPENFGPKENNGCPWPDTDLDGILDKDDRCPNNPGPKENYGCPYTDTDGDSILDKDDECPNVPGVRENNGCPLIEAEDQEIINTAFANLEFLSGKAVIRDESLESLDRLAELLVKKTEWQLRLSGHTDNVGSEKENLILSKRRAEAVQTHLSEHGVEKSRIKVEFFGESQPIASNDTPEGRQKNRRVEMEILFE
ncbi:MAG: DUF5723 family protein [Vicingaceae bacterium]